MYEATIFYNFAVCSVSAVLQSAGDMDPARPVNETGHNIADTVERLFGAATRPDSELLSSSIRQAQLEALDRLLKLNQPGHYVGNSFYSSYFHFHRDAVGFVQQQQSLLSDGISIPLLADDQTEALWKQNDLPEAEEQTDGFRQIAEDITLAELTAALDGKDIPDNFMRILRSDNDIVPGWFDLFVVYFVWRIKSDNNFCRALSGEDNEFAALWGFTGQDGPAVFFDMATKNASKIQGFGGLGNPAELAVITDVQILEQLKLGLSDDQQSMAPFIRQFSKNIRLPVEAALEIAQGMEKHRIPQPQIVPMFRASGHAYNDLRGKLRALPPSNPAASLFCLMADSALGGGRFGHADKYLNNAELSFNTDLTNDDDASVEQGNKDLAEIWIARAMLEKLRCRYLKSSSYFRLAEAILPPDNYPEIFQCRRERAVSMEQHGRISEDDDALNAAIDANTRAMALAPRLDTVPDSVEFLNKHGELLMFVGKRQDNRQRLAEALNCFEDVMSAMDEEETPGFGSVVQLNMADIQYYLGKTENNPEFLELAIGNYTLSLKTRTQEKAPMQWAALQFYLGECGKILGGLRNDPEILAGAAKALRNSLLVRSHEKAPGQWMVSMRMLAETLLIQGRLSNEACVLEEAAGAFCEIAEKMDASSLGWGIAKSNAGEALMLLGSIGNRVDILQDARSELEQALSVFSQEKNPEILETTRENLEKILAHPDVTAGGLAD